MILEEKRLKIFGARIEAARKKKGMTQEELAEKVGVSQAMINFIEKGKKKPSLETTLAIANEFDTTVDSLFSRA
jgi:DNA-binding XRE family transcriptional regulator